MKSTSSNQPAIILVHGFRGSPIGLKAIGKELERAGYQVFVPPIPPFGGAESLDEYTPKAYAEYLLRFAHQHKLQAPVLVGHSMGSIIVAAALHYFPQEFADKAILMSPISVRTAAPFRLIAPLSALLPSRMVDYVTTKFLFVPHDRKLFRETLAITHECSNDHHPKKKQVMSAAKFSTKYAVGDFTSPKQLLFLAGESDHLIPKKQTEKLAEIMPATTVFLTNTGHLHNYEQSKETAQAILDFLQ